MNLWFYECIFILIWQLELERREVEMRAKREEEERKRLEEALRARQEEERKRLEEEELARQKQVEHSNNINLKHFKPSIYRFILSHFFSDGDETDPLL